MAQVAGTFRALLRRAYVLAGGVFVLLALLSGASAAAVDTLENAVKGTYLYKFGPFVQWPETAHEGPDSPVILCIVGSDPFGPALDQAVASQRMGARAITVRRQQTAARESGCHIMYVGGSPAQSIAECLAAVRGTPVLTITDAASNARAPGIIEFVIENNRVRFNIDDVAAAENGIVISSQLLNLARAVRPRG